MTSRLAAAAKAALLGHAGPRVLVRLVGDDADRRARRWNGLPSTKESMTRVMPDKGWHALRNAFCSRLAARGVAATEIQRLAGHVSIKTTQRYLHVSEDRLAAAVMVPDDCSSENENAPTAATIEALVGLKAAKSN